MSSKYMHMLEKNWKGIYPIIHWLNFVSDTVWFGFRLPHIINIQQTAYTKRGKLYSPF